MIYTRKKKQSIKLILGKWRKMLLEHSHKILCYFKIDWIFYSRHFYFYSNFKGKVFDIRLNYYRCQMMVEKNVILSFAISTTHIYMKICITPLQTLLTWKLSVIYFFFLYQLKTYNRWRFGFKKKKTNNNTTKIWQTRKSIHVFFLPRVHS